MDGRLRSWVEGAVGRVRDAVDRSTGRSEVWRVTVDGAPLWVKRHGRARQFGQELRAYRELVPALVAGGVRAPELVATDGVSTLILTDLPGDLARGPAAYRAAGEALRVMHALPYDDPDPVPLSAALPTRLAAWSRGADRALAAEAAAGFGDGAAFAGARRRWCHRDFSARNWRVDGGRFGLLDFEHAGPDHPLLDVARLVEVDFPDAEALAAFAEGYGPIDPGALRRLTWLTVLGTITWSQRSGDAELAEIGERAWARLRARARLV